VVFVGIALAMAASSEAGGSTVAVDLASTGPFSNVLYRAAPGEHNDVIIERTAFAPYSATISDAGAILRAGASCEQVDAHTARCQTSNPPVFHVELDDANDRLRPSRDNGAVLANGGSGDDVLDLGQGFASGALNGGGGRDELRGGQFGGVLSDGDRDGAPGDAGPGPDLLIGGPSQYDTVSYEQRTEPVSVDLAGGTAGADGEDDVVRAAESVIGGAGPDRLAGSEARNEIFGGQGADTLVGRGGDDELGTTPRPIGLFDAVPARFGNRDDRVFCGGGFDRVWLPSRATFIAASCERLVVRRTLPPRFRAQRREFWHVPARPVRHGSSMTYSVNCSFEEDDEDPRRAALRCSGTVTLRDTRKKRLLASGRLPRGHYVLAARLKFTPTGRRLAARRKGVRAFLRVRGRNLPTASWTIRIKLRRR
jgi:hypothetical protein